MWIITVLLVGALLITLTAIVVESPIGRSLAARYERAGGETEARRLERKVELLESEVDDLQRTVERLRDEVQFVQRLLEDPTRKKSPTP
jgi:uncharacterized protein YlxW (UPF0749 family)